MKFVKIKNIKRLNKKTTVYNLECSPHDSYFANNILVHNCKPGEDLIFGKFRMRSVDHLMGEVEMLHDRYHFNILMVDDDLFTAKPDYVMEWCDRYEKIGKPFAIQTRADLCYKHPEIFKRMKEVGLGWVRMGLESGNQRVLNYMRKGTTVEQNYGAVELCHKLGVQVIANYMCMPRGELVLTEDYTITPIENVQTNMSCIGLDGAYHKVLETFERQYSGNIYTIKTNGFPVIKLTAEHPIYVAKRMKSWKPTFTNQKRTGSSTVYYPSEPTWTNPSEVHRGDYLVIPKPSCVNSEPIKLNFHGFMVKTNHTTHPKIPETLELDEDLAWLFGWYIAEGSSFLSKPRKWKSGNKTSCGIVHFYLNITELNYARKICRVIKEKFRLNPHIYHKLNHLDVSIGSQILARFIRDSFGSNALRKQIPSYMFSAKPNIAKSLLNGLFLGDGHLLKKPKHRWQLSTSSKTLAYQTVMLLLKCGIFASIQHCRREGDITICGLKTHVYDRYAVTIHGKELSKLLDVYISTKHRVTHQENSKYYFVPINSIEKENYDGTVHNLRTEDGTYTVPFFSVHNCGLPTETKAEVMDTLNMIRRIKPEQRSAAFYTPIVGTDMYDDCKKHDLLVSEDPTVLGTRTITDQPRLRGIDYDWIQKQMYGRFYRQRHFARKILNKYPVLSPIREVANKIMR